MMQEEEEGDEGDVGNAYEYPLDEEEDIRAHSTRAEDFNFSESIPFTIQSFELDLTKLCTAPPDKLTLSPPRHRPTQRSIPSPSYQEPTKQKLSYKDR